MKMDELLSALPEADSVDYLLDTCFLLHAVEHDKMGKLVDFCKNHKVGMSSFNLDEISHVHHRLDGTVNHHLRDFFKKNLVSRVVVDVHPGDRAGEVAFVRDFDEKILMLVPDPSDAVLFVQALKMRANLLTKDKHHLFTTRAENYISEYGIRVEKEFV